MMQNTNYGGMFSYFEDAHADWVTVPIEETLEGAATRFPNVPKSTTIALLVQFIEGRDEANYHFRCSQCGGYDVQQEAATGGHWEYKAVCVDCLYEWGLS